MNRLRVENLTKFYGDWQALDDVSLEVKASEFMVVMGPSGSGKSTLLLALLGVVKPDSGRIHLDDIQYDHIPVGERNFGYMPQDYGLFPHLNVFENIAFGLRTKGVAPQDIDNRVEQVVTKMGLGGLMHRRPHELSGGQRQRVALSRALIIRPSVLLLDEPLSNVDEMTKAEVRRSLKDIVKQFGVTTVCVLHEPSDAAALGDRIAVMYQGRILQTGRLEDLFENPQDPIVTRLLTSH